MSAIEVINEVRELPVKEQEQVLDFLQKKLHPHKPADSDVKHPVRKSRRQGLSRE
jgi:hypothetical protein